MIIFFVRSFFHSGDCLSWDISNSWWSPVGLLRWLMEVRWYRILGTSRLISGVSSKNITSIKTYKTCDQTPLPPKSPPHTHPDIHTRIDTNTNVKKPIFFLKMAFFRKKCYNLIGDCSSRKERKLCVHICHIRDISHLCFFF